ncbi:MAG: beta-propeller fold lactonase family protein [Thermohalobaculum sp.]|nr:beta-propeller fold lactonase family protein [Thermohalobaculum sp.]
MKPMTFAAFALAVGLAAAPVAHAGPGPLVYIPTGDSAEVLIIDASTNLPIGRVTGLPAAHGLAVTPDGSRLIVGSYDERPCCAALPEKPAEVSAADHAAHHVAKPEAAAQPSVSTVSIVDTATRAIVRRIDVPGAVHHVAVSPDGRTAAVTHPNANGITAIDLETLSVVATVETGTLPNYAAFSPDGAALYVSVAGDNAVAVLDAVTWTVQSRIATGASPEHLVLSPDGSRLFVNNVDDGTVSVIDPSKGRAVESLAIGSTLHGLDLSADGGTLFVAVRDDDRLVAVDLGDGSRRSVALSPAPYHLSVIAGTGVLYVSSAEEPVVWVIDAATLETRAEIPVTGIGHQFAQVSGR